MTAAEKWDLVSVDDYLSGEPQSDVKHEYVGGVVHAMAGANNRHNAIASNILISIGSRLRGNPCRSLNSDTKIRIQQARGTRFYYPDVSIVCDSNPGADSFQDKPVVLVEVMSDATRRIDEGEKKDAYLSIPSLDVYLLVEPASAAVIVFRRTADDGFEREVHTGSGAVIHLPTIEVELPLGEIYEDIEFTE